MAKKKSIKVYNKKREKRLYERVTDINDFCRVIAKHKHKVLYSYFENVGGKRTLKDRGKLSFLGKSFP